MSLATVDIRRSRLGWPLRWQHPMDKIDALVPLTGGMTSNCRPPARVPSIGT